MLAIRLGKLLKEQEEQIKNRDESLEKAREEIKWLRGMLKEQEVKTVIKIEKRFNDCDLTGYCPFCSRPLIKDWAENYCGYCGKPILWESSEMTMDRENIHG